MAQDQKIVTLNTGIEAAEVLVHSTLLTLSSLCESDPILFYELVQVCRDQSHQMWGSSGERLAAMGMMSTPTEAHQAVREIVQASVVGQDLDLRIVDPLAR